MVVLNGGGAIGRRQREPGVGLAIRALYRHAGLSRDTHHRVVVRLKMYPQRAELHAASVSDRALEQRTADAASACTLRYGYTELGGARAIVITQCHDMPHTVQRQLTVVDAEHRVALEVDGIHVVSDCPVAGRLIEAQPAVFVIEREKMREQRRARLRGQRVPACLVGSCFAHSDRRIAAVRTTPEHGRGLAFSAIAVTAIDQRHVFLEARVPIG